MNQKFTGKERDGESGLDYFGARYYGNALGRFTSPDPLLGSAMLSNPQTWNRYAYGLNNPLRNIDPAGLWDWDASAGGSATDEELKKRSQDKDLSRKERKAAGRALAFRANFRSALDAASGAADTSGQATAQNAVDSYGDENDHNGVVVGVAASNVQGSSARTMLNDDDTISVNFNPGLKGNDLAVTVAHEGMHVSDAQDWVNAGEPMGGALDLNHYFREDRVWYVSSYIAEALGMRSYGPKGGGSQYQVWNSGWKAVDRDTLRSRGVDNILKYMGLSPTDTNTYSSEHPSQ